MHGALKELFDEIWWVGGVITSPGNPVKIRCIGNTVYLTGDLRLSNTTGYVWCTIPTEFRPRLEWKYTTFAENNNEYRMIFWVHASGYVAPCKTGGKR